MTKAQKMVVNDLLNYGTSYIGTYEVQGAKVVKFYNAVRQEVEKKTDRKKSVAWDGFGTGEAWII